MLEKWILLITYVGIGLSVGLALRYLVIPRIKKVTEKTDWKSDDLIIRYIGKWVIVWGISLGLYFALAKVTIDTRYDKLLHQAITIFFIFSITHIVSNVVAGMVRIKSADSDNIIPSSSIISNIIKVLIFVVGILVILQTLGISITPVLTALGVGGLAVALALQDTLGNLFAGIHIIASGNIKTGDYVVLDSGQEGFVEDVTWRYSKIKTVANNVIIIPNSKLASIIVSNHYLENKEVGFSVEFGVAYSSNLEFVEQITLDVIRKTMSEVEGAAENFEPVVRYFAFGDSAIQLRAILRAKEHAFQFPIRHAFIKNLHKRFQEEGIEIPFPIRTVYQKA